MSYQARLVSALQEVLVVERVNRDQFLLRAEGAAEEASVLVTADEFEVSDRVRTLAKDALEALGEVGGDPSGESAGVGLLAIHVEELIASKPDVTKVVITSAGLEY